jgi:hypothetical protein
MTWVRHLERMGQNRTACRILLGQPKGRKLLGGPRCRWADNIKMDLVQTGWSRMDWTGMAQDR